MSTGVLRAAGYGGIAAKIAELFTVDFAGLEARKWPSVSCVCLVFVLCG